MWVLIMIVLATGSSPPSSVMTAEFENEITCQAAGYKFVDAVLEFNGRQSGRYVCARK
jgi:hypothetical protein